jgi:hypothetical protein
MSVRNSYFRYAASGSAFGGIITQPTPLVIPSQAMASLSPAGGYGSVTVENFGIAGLMTVRKGTTTVQGDPAQTEVTVTVEDLNIMDVLTVGRIVVHLVGQAPPSANEAAITPASSTIDDVRVHGSPLQIVNQAGLFAQYPTYSELEQAYIDGKLQGLILDPGSLGAPCTAPSMNGCATQMGDVKAALCTLSDGATQLRIKDFATVYFGQFRISKFARRLTMLRVELGCNTGGGLSAGDGSNNGGWEPPN